MTLTDAVILSGIIAAFTIFAMVLAWGEHQTPGLNRNLRQKSEQPSGANEPLAQRQLPAQGDEGMTLAANTSERREMAHSRFYFDAPSTQPHREHDDHATARI